MKTASQIMSREVFSVDPDMGLGELAALFTEKRVSGFPVVDSSGALIGVVTETDLIHQNERLHIPTTVAIFDAVLMLGSSKKIEDELKKMAATTVRQIMTSDPATIGPDSTLTEIATIMGEKNVHTLPVLGNDGKLLGVVGKLDLIRAMAR